MDRLDVQGLEHPSELGQIAFAILLVDPEDAVLVRVEGHRPAVLVEIPAQGPHVGFGGLSLGKTQRHQPTGGLSGGGAAGFELDRLDPRLGSPSHALVLARSEEPDDTHVLVPEEIVSLHRKRPDLARDLLRSEIVFFETPNGGAVFSVGSITFCGSLPHNDFDNNISRMVDNVLRRFRGD